LLHYGDHLPVELRIIALSDISESLQYLHCNSLVHGDIKLSDVLVTGSGQEFLFKITDYACQTFFLVNFIQTTNDTWVFSTRID